MINDEQSIHQEKSNQQKELSDIELCINRIHFVLLIMLGIFRHLALES